MKISDLRLANARQDLSTAIGLLRQMDVDAEEGWQEIPVTKVVSQIIRALEAIEQLLKA